MLLKQRIPKRDTSSVAWREEFYHCFLHNVHTAQSMNRDASPQQDVAIMSEDKDIAQADNTRKARKLCNLEGGILLPASYTMSTLLKRRI